MEVGDLLRYIEMSRSRSVIVDRSIPQEYPGYVRTVTVMPDGVIRVEFETYGCDEGGITYFIKYADYEALVKSLEEYFMKKIDHWENISRTGFYPDQIEVSDMGLVHRKIQADLVNGKIQYKQNGIKTWLPDGYWKRLLQNKIDM